MYFSLSVRARVLVYGLECVLMCMSDISFSVSLYLSLSLSLSPSLPLSLSLSLSPSLPFSLSLSPSVTCYRQSIKPPPPPPPLPLSLPPPRPPSLSLSRLLVFMVFEGSCGLDVHL